MTRQTGRQIKKRVLDALLAPDTEKAVADLYQFPLRQVVNPLLSFFYHREENIRWHAVTAMGFVVSRLADQDMASARVVMRRLMWNLNDESGGIGWGSPEAMGEITARHDRLAEEFGKIVVSYIRKDGNFLEHPVLQQGSLWGFGRLAHARPDIAQPGALHLSPFLSGTDLILQGLAVWGSLAAWHVALEKPLQLLTSKIQRFRLYTNNRWHTVSIGRLARAAVIRGKLNNTRFNINAK